MSYEHGRRGPSEDDGPALEPVAPGKVQMRGKLTPVQRRYGMGRPPAGVSAPAPVQRSASLGGPPVQASEAGEAEGEAGGSELGGRALLKARRVNPRMHGRLGFDPAQFGGGEVGSADFARAVAEYQRANGLGVDGIAGPMTCGHAEAAGQGAGGADTLEDGVLDLPESGGGSDTLEDGVLDFDAAGPSSSAAGSDVLEDGLLDFDLGAGESDVLEDGLLDFPAGGNDVLEDGLLDFPAGGNDVLEDGLLDLPAGGASQAGGSAGDLMPPKEDSMMETRGTIDPGIQLKGASPSDDSDAIHAEAAAGVAGSGSSLPHLDAIQASFGRHDVSGVQAHVGGAAEDASKAIGAEAYATGNHVAFAGAPDLHTAAHEAAHVVQQRAGVQLKGGVGEVGDAYEQHADAVADAVVRGESAQPLLDGSPGGGRTSAVQGYFGEGAVNTAVDWAVRQISSGAELLSYLASVSDAIARQVISRIAAVNRAILVEFLRVNPAHQLAMYIASQLPVQEMVSLAITGAQALRTLLFASARAIGQGAVFVVQLHRDARDAAIQLAHDIETQHLPALLQASAQLAYDLFHVWWPTNTGLEGQVSLTAGAKVPVWPTPPIRVGGEGQFQGELKLYNKSHEGAPQVEFECGTEVQGTQSVGLAIPEVAGVDAEERRQLALGIKTTTRFAEIDWNVGLISALRAGNREGAFDALCQGMGNIVGATQFQFTFAASIGQGLSGEAGLGEYAKASASAMMSLGFQLQVETPNEQHDGKIEAEGSFTVESAGQIKAAIPGVPDNLSPVVGYLLSNASAGTSAQAQLGGRIKFKLPAAPLTDPRAPEFDYVELFVGGQASGRVAREQLGVSGEASIRFGRDDLANFSFPQLSDGMSSEELAAALPFSQLALKGAVTLDSGLAGLGLRRLVAGDNAAINFLTGQPSVGGKVEIEMEFTKDRMVALLVQLGIVRTQDAIDRGEAASGAAVDVIDALRGLNVIGYFAALGAAGGDLATFIWESLDKISIDLHADANHSTPDIPIGSVEASASVRLRAAYSTEYDRAQITQGINAAREYLLRALPPDIGRYLVA